ncbi:MAG TPA: sugar-binding protein [Tepidisphaeraceae bacterium]|jgi:predicted esterase|nr:sugar-binding protein [Tepidisphaeraceae bacterium]
MPLPQPLRLVSIAALTLASLAALNTVHAQTKPAPPPPAIALPQVGQIQIDGATDDWADRGLRANVLTEAAPDRRPYGDHDATVRLGWDDEGLLVRVDVIDGTLAESDRDNTLWLRDGIELFIANGDGTRRVQFIYAPGLDPNHPQPRTQTIDHRPAEARADAPTQTSAIGKTDQGYVLEARVPWAQLGITPAEGAEVRVQAQVNDVDEESRKRQLRLYPIAGANSDSSKMMLLRLADANAAPTVTAVASSGAYERFRRARVNVGAPAALAGKAVEVRDAGKVVATGKLTTQGRLATASLVLPIPRDEYGTLEVAVDGEAASSVTLPDLTESRTSAIENLEVRFTPFVFHGKQFPQVDFEDFRFAEDLIGPYTIETTFYDAKFNPVTSAEAPGRYGAVVSIVPDDGQPLKRYVTLYRAPEEVKWRKETLQATIELPPGLGIDPAVGRDRSEEIVDNVKWSLRQMTSQNGHLAILLAGLHEMQPGEPALQRNGPQARDDAYWYELKKRIDQLEPYEYVATLPHSYETSPDKKWPLILFLHGSGERGSDVTKVLKHGPPKEARAGRDLPFVIISPQCPARHRWNVQMVRDLLDEVKAKYRIDPDRVYLTGLSMGGFGSWSVATAYPNEFAALVPVCGGGDPKDVARIKDIPTWVTHGGKDEVVFPEDSYRMVAALREIGGRVRFTLFPEADHDSWTATYSNPQLYEWMLQQRRGAPQQPPATTAGTQPSE